MSDVLKPLSHYLQAVDFGDIVCVGKPDSKLIEMVGATVTELSNSTAYLMELDEREYDHNLDSTGKSGFLPIPLSAKQVALGWNRSLGLLVVQDQANSDSVWSTLQLWAGHVLDGGLIILEDSSNLGALSCQAKLTELGVQAIDVVGSYSVYRKSPQFPALPILPTWRSVLAISSNALSSDEEKWWLDLKNNLHPLGITFDLIVLADRESDLIPAETNSWDATVVIGCSGDEQIQTELGRFTNPRFGTRVQVILEDPSGLASNDHRQRIAYRDINRAFSPNSVFFGNSNWKPGTFTDFLGDRFAVLPEGLQAGEAARMFLMSVRDDGRAHYLFAPELGMHGKWPLETRVGDIQGVTRYAKGAHVLDIGCAEGVIASRMRAAGAVSVEGFDLDASRIVSGRALADNQTGVSLYASSVAPWKQFAKRFADVLRPSYDIVLFLAVYQHLPVAERDNVLDHVLLLCTDLFAFRTPEPLFKSANVHDRIIKAGFEATEVGEIDETGRAPIRIYRRSK